MHVVAVLITAAALASPAPSAAPASSAPAPAPSATEPSAPLPKVTIPPHGAAFISTLPAAANVWLDGTYVGQTPLYVDGLDPGSHSLTVSRATWKPVSLDVFVEIGRVATVSVVLTRALGAHSLPSNATGSVTVRGGPPGAAVFVDGVKVGKLPLEAHKLAPGHHIVSVVGARPVHFLRDVEVYPDAVSVVTLAPGLATTGSDADDTTLAPVYAYVPAANVTVARDVVTIHYHGTEVECAIGSRAYTINGRESTLAVPPALVGGKVFLPVSLLKRIASQR